MNMENLPSRLRQGNELHISWFLLTKTRVDEAWFQSITWAYYFWLGLFKWDKIGQNYRCVSSLESTELWGEGEEESGIDFSIKNHQKHRRRLFKQDVSNSSRAFEAVKQLSMVSIFHPGAWVRGEAAGDRLALNWCLYRGQGSLLGLEVSTWSISGHPGALLRLTTVQLTNSILHGVNEGKTDVCCPSGDTLCASACASVTINHAYT